MTMMTLAGIHAAQANPAFRIMPRPVCTARFHADTPIATPAGDVPLNRLAPEHTVLTSNGFARIRVQQTCDADDDDDGLVLVPAGAFGPGTPLVDLHLAPTQLVALRLPGERPARPLPQRPLAALVRHPNPTPAPARMITIETPEPMVIYLAGLPVWVA